MFILNDVLLKHSLISFKRLLLGKLTKYLSNLTPYIVHFRFLVDFMILQEYKKPAWVDLHTKNGPGAKYHVILILLFQHCPI